MYTRFFAAYATIRSRVIAPPAPLIIRSCGSTLVCPVEEVVHLFPPIAKSTSGNWCARASVSVAWLVGTHRMSSFSSRTRSASASTPRLAVRPVPSPTIIPD